MSNANFDYNDKTVQEIDTDPYLGLDEIRKKNIGRVVIGHLNINSLRNKFEALKSLIEKRIDILVVTETKIDQTFSSNEFSIDGFSTPFRLDRNIRTDIPCKELNKHNSSSNFEGIFIELNFRNNKWVLFGGYNPNKQLSNSFFSELSKSLDMYIASVDNLLVLGDFNTVITEENMKNFCDSYNLTNLIKEPTCFKSLQNPTSIDVILTNRGIFFSKLTLFRNWYI